MTRTARGAPLVFAHRGASEACPEHTLAAYQRALAEGADGVECDVRLTRDGHLVCLHDRRLDRTSNGSGLVRDHTLAQLQDLDFGSWRGHEPAPVLTLDRLLGLLRDAGRPVDLLIETKHPSRYGPEVEHRLVPLLRRHGVSAAGDGPVRVTVMSFSALALRRVRKLAPELSTVMLLDLLPPGLRPVRLPFARIAGPSIELIRARPRLVPALQAAGNRIYAWTVNAPADIDLAMAQGVDGIITDRPAQARAHLGR